MIILDQIILDQLRTQNVFAIQIPINCVNNQSQIIYSTKEK